MKVLYGHQIFTRQAYGGISRYFHEISQRIPNMGCDSTEIFAPLHVNAYLTKNTRLARPSKPLEKFRGGAAILGAIDIAIGLMRVRPRIDIDVYHSSYYALIDYRPRRCLHVVTVYDMIHELEPTSFSRHDITVRLKRRSVSAADHVICISENTRKDLLNITGIAAEKTSVIHLGHSLTSGILPRRAGGALHAPFILHVGNRGGYKNFTLLLRAFANSKELRGSHRLVCFGGGAFTEEEQASIKAYGMAERISHTMGGDDALSGLYSTAALLVYPSRREGFGIPPLEAMAHGCPVVCARASSLPEVAGDAAEYFDPEDPYDLLQAIERILRTPTCAASLVARGLSRAREFSWDKCAAETLALYHRMRGESNQ